MSRRTTLVLVLAIGLVASACGSRVAPELLTTPSLADATDADRVMIPDDPPPSPNEDAYTENASPATHDPEDQPGTATSRQRESADGGDASPEGEAWEARPSELVALHVEPTCVYRGQPMAATIETEAGLHLTLVVSYADGRPHGQMGFAQAGPDGMYTWRWVVAPSVPSGDALVYVAASDMDDGRRDWATEPFMVSVGGGCA